MAEIGIDRSITRRRFERICSLAILIVAATFLFELPLLPFGVDRIELLVIVLLLFLAVSVLIGAGGSVWRVFVAANGATERNRLLVRSLPRLFTSAVLGVLAAITLWWTIGSLYVYFTGAGGIPPTVVALLFGSVLSLAIVARDILSIARSVG